MELGSGSELESQLGLRSRLDLRLDLAEAAESLCLAIGVLNYDRSIRIGRCGRPIALIVYHLCPVRVSRCLGSVIRIDNRSAAVRVMSHHAGSGPWALTRRQLIRRRNRKSSVARILVSARIDSGQRTISSVPVQVDPAKFPDRIPIQPPLHTAVVYSELRKIEPASLMIE